MKAKPIRARLTKRMLVAFQHDPDKRIVIHDTEQPGLVVTIFPTGVKTFSLYRRIGGKPERISLGKFPVVTIEQARDQVKLLNGKIVAGENPAAIKRVVRGEVTLQELFDRALIERRTRKGKALSEQTITAYTYLFNQTLEPLRSKKLSQVRQEEIKRIHRGLTPARANMFKHMLSATFEFGIKQELTEHNPAKALPDHTLDSRERFLQTHEMASFLTAVEADEHRDYWLLLLLTGARSGNVRAMRWQDINLKEGVWTPPTSKTGEALRIVLVPEAVKLLEDRKRQSILHAVYVFPGRDGKACMMTPKRQWYALLERAGIENLRVHDLRRTLGSWQARQGASLPIIGKSLGHATQAATAIYARLDLDPVRDSVTAATTAMLKEKA